MFVLGGVDGVSDSVVDNGVSVGVAGMCGVGNAHNCVVGVRDVRFCVTALASGGVSDIDGNGVAVLWGL